MASLIGVMKAKISITNSPATIDKDNLTVTVGLTNTYTQDGEIVLKAKKEGKSRKWKAIEAAEE